MTSQDDTPVLAEIARLQAEGLYSFSLPGHRFGQGVDEHTAQVIGRDTFGADVIMAKSVVGDAEELYAQAVGARQAVFTTCGSSISIHTGLLTVIGPGSTVLVDRNVHKSVVASLILAGADPVWLSPSWDQERQIAHPATTDSLRSALEAHPEAKAVLLITPTEYGSGADVRTSAQLCHDHGIPLMVDEAWGGHFGFHPDPPTAAVQAGADLAVQSLHKACAGLCQASMILVGGGLVDPVVLRQRLDLITTTSPSALLYGSIDGWRRHLALNGKELIDGALERARTLRARLSRIDGLQVDDSLLGVTGVAEWDPLKLCVDVTGLGLTGYAAKQWLQEQAHLAAQLGDARRLVFSLTYADTDEAEERLVAALQAMAADPPSVPSSKRPAIPDLSDLELEQVMSLREAYFADSELVSDPVGRVSAEMVSPYPPGVPTIMPGERVTEPVVTYLRDGVAAGMTIPDAADPQLGTFRVVREPAHR